MLYFFFFFFKQKTAYEIPLCDWSSDVCSSDLRAQAASWDRMHPRLTHRGAWADHPGRLPIVEGTLIRLAVDHLPGARAAKPVWLWTSAVDADVAAVTRGWQAYLRRFDLEHTIRFAKQVLG